MLPTKFVLTLLASGFVGFHGLHDPTMAPDLPNQGSTKMEVRQTILQRTQEANETKVGRADAYSKDGALEFWSSGGLLNIIEPGGARDERYDHISMQAKHIEVITLVEGKVAVAHYYSEGSMKPVGSPAVSHYFTRVSQVFVKEDGKWMVRSSHWSPVGGGSGTSQVTEQAER